MCMAQTVRATFPDMCRAERQERFCKWFNGFIIYPEFTETWGGFTEYIQ